MKRLLYLIPLALYLAFYGASYYVLASRIPEPVNITLPTPHYVAPELKPLVDKYQLYGVDIYYNTQINWKPEEWGRYYNKTIHVRDEVNIPLEIKLNHEYIHYKQEKSPPPDWRPFYDSNPRLRERMSFYKPYLDHEVEAVACTEIRYLPEPYLSRCNYLINRDLPFTL